MITRLSRDYSLVATLCVLSFSSSICAFAEDITVLGLDTQGHSVAQVISGEEYQTRLQGTLQGVNDSVMPILRNSKSLSSHHGRWWLRTIAVGTGLAAQVGPAPLFSATARGRFRLVYSNSINPIFPD